MMDEVIAAYLPIIKQHFPNIHADAIQALTNGEWHEVFLVQDTVFRFPRSEEVALKDMIEEQFFTQFSQISPVAIPKVQGHLDKVTGKAYQTYSYIPGVPLTKERIARLSHEAFVEVAETMGKFLSILHSFPVDEAKKLGMDSVGSAQEYGRYFLSALKIDEPVLRPRLTANEWHWVKENIMRFSHLSQSHPFPLVVTHSELLPKHILFDEKTQKLEGIIDFSLNISDPAHDFKYFDRYGDVFLQRVYEHYLPVDTYFEKRRMFHARDMLVGDVYFAIVTKKNEAEQKELVSELKGYIAAHPLSDEKA